VCSGNLEELQIAGGGGRSSWRGDVVATMRLVCGGHGSESEVCVEVVAATDWWWRASTS
jgi:hypothetical protein